MKFLYIFLLLLVTSFQVKSQVRVSAAIDPEDKIVRFYPNPATTQITFDFQRATIRNYSFQVFNFLGKKVFELNTIPSSKTTIDVTNFFRGVYIFQLKDRTNGKVSESGRFQVFH